MLKLAILNLKPYSKPKTLSVTQRVQVPNSKVLGSQMPYSEWFLDPENLVFGYLDPYGLGFRITF